MPRFEELQRVRNGPFYQPGADPALIASLQSRQPTASADELPLLSIDPRGGRLETGSLFQYLTDGPTQSIAPLASDQHEQPRRSVAARAAPATPTANTAGQPAPIATAAAQVVPAATTASGQSSQAALPQRPVRLQTSLDSRVVVRSTGTGQYAVLVEGDAGAQVSVATLELRQCYPASSRALPFYIEDLVTADRALVRVRYDERHVELNVLQTDAMAGGRLVQVQGIPGAIEQIQIAQAPATRQHGQGHLADGGETVAHHHNASGVDLAMASIAGAEGGFASTEGSDAGVFTWGQGQWTVTEGDSNLQAVLRFIKERRPDLFALHFGSKGLDINGQVFQFQGQAFASTRPRLHELFQASPERNRQLVSLFAQAGTDPQIQRLQREFLRHEVEHTLSASVRRGGATHTPTSWLTPRGLALYYSMNKNLPSVAQAYFTEAIAAAGGGADTAVTEQMRQHASQLLEHRFQRSNVKAPDPQNGNRWYAFWGEDGREQAIQQADEHLASLRAQIAQTKDPHARQPLARQLANWQQHRGQLTRRESRYQKTVGSLGAQNIEAELPVDARASFVTLPPPPPRPDPDLGHEDPDQGMSVGPVMSLPTAQAEPALP